LPAQENLLDSSTDHETGTDDLTLLDLLADLDDEELATSEALAQTAARNSRSELQGKEVLGDEPMWDTPIRSRVLKDPLHVFRMFYISQSHGLCVAFTQAL